MWEAVKALQEEIMALSAYVRKEKWSQINILKFLTKKTNKQTNKQTEKEKQRKPKVRKREEM